MSKIFLTTEEYGVLIRDITMNNDWKITVTSTVNMPEYPRSPFKKTDTSITPKVDGDAIDATIIGETTPAAGNFTTVNADSYIMTCNNATGSEIAVRSICYISGDQSGVPQITKAQADSEANSKGGLVMTMSAIANGNDGDCCIAKKVSGFSGLTPGSIQYLSDDTSGAMEETATTTSTKIVRIVGYALSATVLWFNPDISYIELA